MYDTFPRFPESKIFFFLVSENDFFGVQYLDGTEAQKRHGPYFRIASGAGWFQCPPPRTGIFDTKGFWGGVFFFLVPILDG